MAGKYASLGRGEKYIVPGNVEHYARCSETAAKILDSFSPAQEEVKCWRRLTGSS